MGNASSVGADMPPSIFDCGVVHDIKGNPVDLSSTYFPEFTPIVFVAIVRPWFAISLMVSVSIPYPSGLRGRVCCVVNVANK